jgi:hypothetical protein
MVHTGLRALHIPSSLRSALFARVASRRMRPGGQQSGLMVRDGTKMRLLTRGVEDKLSYVPQNVWQTRSSGRGGSA